MATEGNNQATPTPRTPWESISPPTTVITVPGGATSLPPTAPASHEHDSVTISLVAGPVVPAQLTIFDLPPKQPAAETPAPMSQPVAMPMDADALSVRQSDSATPAPLPEPLSATVCQTAAAPVAATTSTTPVRAEKPGGWSIPMLCLGIGILACCLVVPQADTNHRLIYQREKLKADLTQIDKQIATNADFLKRVSTDPTLAERLAQRQLKVIRPGTAILDIPGTPPTEMSPYLILSVPPPAQLPPYQPVAGFLGDIFRQPRLHLYLTGCGLMLVAAGLILGYAPRPS